MRYEEKNSTKNKLFKFSELLFFFSLYMNKNMDNLFSCKGRQKIQYPCVEAFRYFNI